MSPSEAPQPPEPRSRRGLVLLAVGAATGLALATSGLLDFSGGRPTLGPDAVAEVNGQEILTADFERLIEGVESERRTPLDEETKRHVLDRMIDEELLVQRALDLGLARVDRRVRAELTSNVISSIVGEVEDRDPSPAELEQHYEQYADFFTIPGRIHVRQLFFRVPPGSNEAQVRDRAEAARARLVAGEDFTRVRREAADREISPVPDAPIPLQKLREYVGPSIVADLDALPEGAWSEPLRSAMGIHVLQVVERQPDHLPPLADIRKQVASDWRRRQGDEALRRYLDELRADGDVRIREEALTGDSPRPSG